MWTNVSDRERVIARAREYLATESAGDAKEASYRAIRDQFNLVAGDGIWGGSEAAVCIGFAGDAEDVDLLDEIVESVVTALK